MISNFTFNQELQWGSKLQSLRNSKGIPIYKEERNTSEDVG